MRLRRPLKIAGIVLASLLGLLAAAGLGLWAGANTATGRAWLADAVESALSTDGSRASVDGLSGPLPQDARLDRLVLRDADGAWLTVEGARLAWAPLDLLSGRLTVRAVAAERIALDRLPAGETDTDDTEPARSEPFEVPRLPVSVRLDELRVQRLEIAEAVAGTAAAFRIAGQAAAPQDGRLTTTLSVARLDGPSETLDLDAGYDRAAGTLAVDLGLDAPADGLLAGLLDLPGGGAIALRLDGSGPVDAWPGRLTAQLGEAARLDTRIEVTDFARLALEGTAAAPGFLTGEVGRLVGGPVDFDLALARKGGSGARIERGRITTKTLEASLSGGLGADGRTVDAQVDLKLTDPAPLNALAAPARVDGLSANLTAQGPLASPQIGLSAKAARAGVPEAELDGVTIQARASPRDGFTAADLKIDVESPRGTFALPELAAFDGHPVALSAEGRLALDTLQLSKARATAKLKGLRLALDGGGDLGAPAGDAAFDLQLAELGALEPVVPLGLRGAGTITGHAAFGGDGPPVVATLAGELDGVGFGLPILTALLHDRVRLATDLTLRDDGGLTLSGLSLDSPSARISGDLSLPGDFETLDGRFDASLPNAGVLSQALGVPLAGQADLTAQLRGPLGDPGVDANLTLSDAAVAGQTLGTAKVRARAERLASGARGEVEISTTASPAGPAGARTAFALEGERFTLSELTAEVPGLQARGGALAIPLAGGAIQGQVALRSEQLRPLLAQVAGLPADAGADLDVSLGADDAGGQRVAVDGSLSDIALPDGGPRTARADVRARIDDAFAAPALDAEVRLTDAAAGPASLDRVRLTAAGGLDDLDVSAEADGEMGEELAVALAGKLARDDGAMTVTLAKLRTTLGRRTVKLARPATAVVDGDEVALRELALDVGDGRINLTARRDAREVALTLDASQVPLSYTRMVLAEPQLSGRLDMSAELSGPLGEPTGSLTLSLREVGSEGTDLPPLALDLDARLRAAEVVANARLTGVGDDPLQMNARVPVAVRVAPIETRLRDDGDLSGRIAWEGDVAPLMPLVPATGHRLTGRADLNFELSGTPADPRMAGEATLTGARYENLDTGTLLTEMAATIRATGERIEIARFTAKDGGDGTLDVTGGIDLDAKRGLPIDVAIRADNARLARLDYLVADADVELDATGSLQDMTIAGIVTVNQAEARIPESLPPEVADLEVVTEEELAAREQAAREAAAKRAETGEPAPAEAEEPARTELDIAVDMPGQVFLRGNGLDSEWKGNLLVTGTAAEPRVRGQLQAVRGRVSLLNKVFELDKGQVAFAGGREIDPRLDIRAVNEGPDLTAAILVKGSAASPSLELTSTPPLPQDQILSRLLFGKNPGQLTAVESAQLAAAVAQLSFSGGGPGLLDQLRDFVGVDVLQVGGDTESGPTVEAGKYVTDEVFVGVEQGASATSSKVKVEVDVTDTITLESDVGVTGDSSVGVQFRWDY
jgi:translocation and assembly module TamB